MVLAPTSGGWLPQTFQVLDTEKALLTKLIHHIYQERNPKHSVCCEMLVRL